MGFGPSLSEIKEKVNNEMESLYNNYSQNCQTREQLNTILQKKYLTQKLVENLNNNKNGNNYYNKVRNRYLDKFELICKNKKLEEKVNDMINKQNDTHSKQLQDEISRNNQKIRDLENQNYSFLNEIQEMHRKQQEDLMNHQNYLRQIQEKNYEEIEKKDKALKEIMNKYQNDMQIMKQKAEKDKKEFEEKQKKVEENNKKIIENFEKRIKEEKDEIKKQELIKQQKLNKKKEEIRNEFIKQVENIKKEKINEILKNFEKIKNTYCIDKISVFSEEKIKLFITDLFRSEKIIKIIIYHLNIFIENIKHKIKNIEHLNIILVGPCGSGKSTLINSLLNVNAEVDFGKPVTKKFEFYCSEKIPFLRLTDSRGIEKNEAFGVNSIYNLIKKYIETKIEETNEDSIKKAKEHILNNFEIKEEDFIPILAQEVQIPNSQNKIHPFGLNRLIEDSINKSSNAVNSACYEGIMEEMKKIIITKLEELIKKLKEKSNKNADDINSYLSKGSKMEDLQKVIVDFIIKLNFQYFFLDPEIEYDKNTLKSINRNLDYSISRETNIKIESFAIEFFEETYKYFNKNIDESAEKYAEELLNKISNFQNDFNKLHKSLLEVTWTSLELKIQLKNFIKESIYQKFELFAIKNSFSFITNKLIEDFKKFFLDAYIEGMTRKTFKEKAKSSIKISFDEINKKIKEYTEKNKERIPDQQNNERLHQQRLFDEEEEDQQ